MWSEEEILGQLSERGFRITRARRAIIHVFTEESERLTPSRLVELARRHCPTVGLVTAYRTLDILAQLGFVRRIHSDNGCHAYAAVEHGHRHHVICRHCGRVVEFEGCDLSDLLERVTQETGFLISEHMLELAGECPQCRQSLSEMQPTSQKVAATSHNAEA